MFAVVSEMERFFDALRGLQRTTPTLLWGVAPTGPVHLGYLAYKHMLRRARGAGISTVALVATYHAYLDDGKARWSELDDRTASYLETFAVFDFGATTTTTALHTSPAYVAELLRLSSALPVSDVARAGIGTLRRSAANTTVADLVYVAQQILDVHALDVDGVICGRDEAPIYEYGLPHIERLFGRRALGFYLPMCPGLDASEMHASDRPRNRIALGEARPVLEEHIAAAVHRGREPLRLVRYLAEVVLPLAGHDELAGELAQLDHGAAGAEIVAATMRALDLLDVPRPVIGAVA